MKFYQLHKIHEAGTSAGFEYFTNKKEAQRAVIDWLGDTEESVCDAEGSVILEIEIEPTKQGVLSALNRWAKHPDNG